jgi:hypothetical protein
MDLFKCNHINCTHTGFNTRNGLSKHEKRRDLHPCTPDHCPKCAALKDKMVEIKKTFANYACRHQNCGKSFVHQQALSKHEIDKAHYCLPDCEKCKKTALVQERRYEKRKHEEESCQNKRCKKIFHPGNPDELIEFGEVRRKFQKSQGIWYLQF